MSILFVSSRSRHTRCSLVTGVQTCALPIFPTAPNSMVRGWYLAQRNLRAFANVTGETINPNDPITRIVAQARVQTLYYRNFFSSDDAKDILPTLLQPLDRLSLDRLGYRLSDLARALFDLLEKDRKSGV